MWQLVDGGNPAAAAAASTTRRSSARPVSPAARRVHGLEERRLALLEFFGTCTRAGSDVAPSPVFVIMSFLDHRQITIRSISSTVTVSAVRS